MCFSGIVKHFLTLQSNVFTFVGTPDLNYTYGDYGASGISFQNGKAQNGGCISVFGNVEDQEFRYFVSRCDLFSFDHCNFTNCEAEDLGGATYLYNVPLLSFVVGTFASNKATRGKTQFFIIHYAGGALYSESSYIDYNFLIFDGNNATDGGALYLSSSFASSSQVYLLVSY